MRLPPQDHKVRRACSYRNVALHHASLHTCARMDAIHRMFSAVANLHLATAAGCLEIAFIHTYWTHGSHALGLVEAPNPILITHVSHVNFNPAFDRAGRAVNHLIFARMALDNCTLPAREDRRGLQ
eukprot:903436-Pleurochrysis_carterae.AAC.1